mmetsp:Transcript_80598/g.250113  ORF Transcript_80598/g.250113 Transcript_80598/m.250113 type:complete len:204 (-) Transcript_80598:1615-2226(-)
MEGQRDGYVARPLPVVVRRDQQQGRGVLGACARHSSPHHPRAREEVLPDHGPQRGLSDGSADPVPDHAVRRHLLPEGRHLPVGGGPTQGQHAGAGLLRVRRPQAQARDRVAPHALRAEEGPVQDVEVGSRQCHLHGGRPGGCRAQDPGRVLPQGAGVVGVRRGRRDALGEGRAEESVPGLCQVRSLLPRGVRGDDRRPQLLGL